MGYVNTTYGDTRVPIPSQNSSVTIEPGQEDILELVTTKVPLAEVDKRRITSDTDADGLINPIDPDDDGDHIYSRFETQGENRYWQRSDDFDNDEISNYLDPDDENDGYLQNLKILIQTKTSIQMMRRIPIMMELQIILIQMTMVTVY